MDKLALVIFALLLSSMAQAPQTHSSRHPPRSGADLLRSIGVLNDSGRLDDPSAVSKIFQISLAATSQGEIAKQPARCDYDNDDRSAMLTTYNSSATDWLEPTDTGVSSMPVRNWFNRQTVNVTGKTRFFYSKIVSIKCSGSEKTIETSMSFAPLSTYACITGVDIMQWLPNAQLVRATDGVLLYIAAGKASSVEFEFAGGAPCAVSVRMKKKTSDRR